MATALPALALVNARGTKQPIVTSLSTSSLFVVRCAMATDAVDERPHEAVSADDEAEEAGASTGALRML